MSKRLGLAHTGKPVYQNVGISSIGYLNVNQLLVEHPSLSSHYLSYIGEPVYLNFDIFNRVSLLTNFLLSILLSELQ